MGGDIGVVDPEPGQLLAHETAERIASGPGDQRRAVAAAGRRDRHVGGTSAEELPEGRHVLETDTDLQWIDVDATAADGQHVERL